MRSMVEGAAHACRSKNRRCNAVCVAQDVDRIDTENLEALRGQKRIAAFVASRRIAHRVGDTIDLNRKSGRRAEQIEHVAASRMMSAKAQALG